MPRLDAAARDHAGALDARDVITAANFREFEFGAGSLPHDVHGFTFTVTPRDGRVVAHDDLTHGEERLLGCVDYLACNPAVVFADELPTGLSGPRLAACLAACGPRQVFLACRDPAPLLRHLAPARWLACERSHAAARRRRSSPCSRRAAPRRRPGRDGRPFTPARFAVITPCERRAAGDSRAGASAARLRAALTRGRDRLARPRPLAHTPSAA
ncbi:hypothetical protein SAMN02745121_02210 [Nannocystis exedens]|uniref:Uncharacterized protein n=1 Tax=Nannocystis exedens TaxID=54 RepID=A0A1I1WAW8_9BACT|nr:hypothetical protein [Nannocystis exedens]PCC67573.1 hypothetical protein NAEX_00580 [Nannocystis exedens]SFD92149.1 hypothetical protein SAMN02745121_02210 [Nannocystis exedens]